MGVIVGGAISTNAARTFHKGFDRELEGIAGGGPIFGGEYRPPNPGSSSGWHLCSGQGGRGGLGRVGDRELVNERLASAVKNTVIATCIREIEKLEKERDYLKVGKVGTDDENVRLVVVVVGLEKDKARWEQDRARWEEDYGEEYNDEEE